MKLGFGVYHHSLTPENPAFARQRGVPRTRSSIWRTSTGRGSGDHPRDDRPTGSLAGWGRAGDLHQLWQLEAFLRIKRNLNSAGLEWEVIENFDPADGRDVLLDGPQKMRRLENLKTILRATVKGVRLERIRQHRPDTALCLLAGGSRGLVFQTDSVPGEPQAGADFPRVGSPKKWVPSGHAS